MGEDDVQHVAGSHVVVAGEKSQDDGDRKGKAEQHGQRDAQCFHENLVGRGSVGCRKCSPPRHGCAGKNAGKMIEAELEGLEACVGHPVQKLCASQAFGCGFIHAVHILIEAQSEVVYVDVRKQFGIRSLGYDEHVERVFHAS